MSLHVRELINYLGALIITVGVVRLVVEIFSDASDVSIIAALYVAALFIGFLSYRLSKKTGWLSRLSEVLEVLAALSAALATGVLLRRQADLSGEVAAIIPASVTAVWGLLRLKGTTFASTAILIPSAMVIGGCVSSLIDAEGPNATLPMMGIAFFLLFVGTLHADFGLPFRLVGGVTLLSVAPQWVAERGSFGGLVVTLAIGSALFVIGAANMWLELLIIGSVIITIAVSTYVFRNVDNEVLQGLTVVVIGLAMLGITTVIYRRRRPAI